MAGHALWEIAGRDVEWSVPWPPLPTPHTPDALSATKTPLKTFQDA